MKRALTLVGMLAVVACVGAAGAPIGDFVRGISIVSFLAGLASSMVGSTRVAGEAFGAAMVLLVTSIGIDWLAVGTREMLGHWEVWVALGGLGYAAFGVGAVVLIARAVFVTVSRPQVPRMPRQSRTPFVEPLDVAPPWGQDNPPRSRREDRDADETGVFGGGRRRR